MDEICKRPVGDLKDDFDEWVVVDSRDISQPGKGIFLEFFRMSGLDEAGQRWRYFRRAESTMDGRSVFGEAYGFVELPPPETPYHALDSQWVLKVQQQLAPSLLRELNEYVAAKTQMIKREITEGDV